MQKIIVGDFSGIQNYLYDIKKNKSATKRLKGRSTFIELLLNKVKEDLKKELGNCEEYIISGGKFIIICNDFVQNKFEKYKKNLEEKLRNHFYGELKIIFGISDYNDNNFKTCLNKAFEDLEKNKNKAFSSIFIKDGKWNSDMFIFNDNRGTDTVCSFSRGDLIDNKITDGYVNDIIKEEEVDGMGLNTKNDIIISNFIAGNKGGNKNIKVFGSESIEIDENYKKYLPKNKDGIIKSFEDISGEGKFNKLACLKGDIDDLGKLFMFELKEDNYKNNYKILSEKFDNFWDKTLYEIIGKKDIYVVYAGGDDFLILGKWDEIIEFYKDLQNEFKKFTNSDEIQSLLEAKKEITFSGAINLFGPHDTFFTVVKQTDELLQEAKEGNKNNINIFGKVISNNDFIKLFEEINKFEGEYNIYDKEKSIISTQTLRFLLDIARKIILEENDGKDKNGNVVDFFEYGLWKAELFYMLGRNYSYKNENNDEKRLKNEFNRYINGMIFHNLHNLGEKFQSLTKKVDYNNLFDKSSGEKLFVMMSYLLYKLRG